MSSGNDNRWAFDLYVAGNSPKTDHTVAMLKQICEKHLEGRCDIEVINVMETPAAAIQENILATPTLLKKLPKPSQRIFGDLSDLNQVLSILGINSEK